MEIIIKPFEEKELEQVKELLMECFPEIGTPSIKFHEEKKHFTLLAKEENTIIGHAHIDELYDNISNESYYLLNYFCVKKTYQNKGIGSKLLNYIIEMAQKNNISYIELTSKKERQSAHHLYLKNNFYLRETCVFRKIID